MADTPETYIPISPAKERALYLITAALAAVVSAVHLWWAWEGRGDWVQAVAPLGLLTAAVSNLACRSRPRLYAALSAVAAGLLLAGLILLVARQT